MTSLQTLISQVSVWADQDPESDYRDTSLQLLERLGAGDEPALAAGISAHPLSHQEVIDSGKAAEPVISKLLADIAQSL